MESNDYSEDTHEEVCSLSEAVSTFSSDDEQDCSNLSQETVTVTSQSSSMLKEESDARNYDKTTFHLIKRKHIIHEHEERVISEKKRRQIIRDKVDILVGMITPNPPKMDYASKIDYVVVCMKILKDRRDAMAKAYTDAGYLPPYERAPLISPYVDPWGYYAHPLVMPHQNMPFIPQYTEAAYVHLEEYSSQGYETSSDQTDL